MTLNSKLQRHASKVPRSIAEREDPQAVTVTAAARSAATQRGLRGPVCRHRGSQHAARSADCGEELRGASAKRWRSVAECMHGAKERSQREALAECWRSQREALAEPAGSRWLRKGISAERCAHCALHSSTWCSSDLKDGCPLETCSSQDRDSLLPRVGLRSDAVMSNLLSSPQTPGGTAVSCYATSLPLPPSPSSSRPFPVRASVTSKKKNGTRSTPRPLFSPRAVNCGFCRVNHAVKSPLSPQKFGTTGIPACIQPQQAADDRRGRPRL